MMKDLLMRALVIDLVAVIELKWMNDSQDALAAIADQTLSYSLRQLCPNEQIASGNPRATLPGTHRVVRPNRIHELTEVLPIIAIPESTRAIGEETNQPDSRSPEMRELHIMREEILFAFRVLDISFRPQARC